MPSLPKTLGAWPAWSVLIAAVGIVAIIGASIVFEMHRPVARYVPAHRVHVMFRVPPRTLAGVAPAKLKVVSAPSAFDLEQRMSFGQLMKRWNPLIAEASKRFGVPQDWIRIVMRVESGGRTMTGQNQPITSSAGAMGLMQLLRPTYEDMRAEYELGPDPYAARDNVLAGAAYLRWLRAKYGYPAMFAAYNDGPGNLEARLTNAGLLPAETRSYLSRVTAAIEGGGAVAGAHGSPVKFTRPNGLPILIDPGAVISIRAALPGEYAPGVQSVIAMGRIKQGVCESLANAKAILRAHGAPV